MACKRKELERRVRSPATSQRDCPRARIVLLRAVCEQLAYRTGHKHTRVEWLRFVTQIECQVPEEDDMHLILDERCRYGHASVRPWLAKRKRIHMHFAPAPRSWMDRGERSFADLATNCLRSGSFRSMELLSK